MGLLQKVYIQKSRIFLLPLTGMKKHRIYRPLNTYISADNLYSKEYPNGITLQDNLLLIVYSKDDEKKEMINKNELNFANLTNNWQKFETEVLMSNRNFVGFYETKDEYIYTFDMNDWLPDWNNFINGSYSKFSSDAKELILKFRWKSLLEEEQRKLYCYLYPYKDECLQSFAQELNMSVEQLRETKELCNKPNLVLENYTNNNEQINNKELMRNENKD